MSDSGDDPPTCPDCQHPWSAHEAGGCLARPKGKPPCTCRRGPPTGDITVDWGDVAKVVGAEPPEVNPDEPPPLPYGSLIIRGPDGVGRIYRADPATGRLPDLIPDLRPELN